MLKRAEPIQNALDYLQAMRECEGETITLGEVDSDHANVITSYVHKLEKDLEKSDHDLEHNRLALEVAVSPLYWEKITEPTMLNPELVMLAAYYAPTKKLYFMGIGKPVRVGDHPDNMITEYHMWVDGELKAPRNDPTHYAPLTMPVMRDE